MGRRHLNRWVLKCAVEVVAGIARVAEGSGVVVEDEVGGIKEVLEGRDDVIVRFDVRLHVC